MFRKSSGSWIAVALLVVGAGLTSMGCASSGGVRPSASPSQPAAADAADTGSPQEIAQPKGDVGSQRFTLDVSITSEDEPVVEEYDPWMPFNEGTFAFNRQFDRFALKPVATVWDTVVPGEVQRSLKNAFDNLGMPRRLVNNLLQGKGGGAAREVGRFLINSTLLVLPVLPPVTVRDGIGAVVDLALDPLNYFLPFVAIAGMTGGKTVNERSQNIELYQNAEEGVVDLYSAVRNAYLQRREKLIKE